MNRMGLLKAVNILLMAAFLIQALTAVILFFNIKTPYIGEVSEIHEYNGMLMLVLIVIHIALNWGWIKMNFFHNKKAG